LPDTIGKDSFFVGHSQRAGARASFAMKL